MAILVRTGRKPGRVELSETAARKVVALAELHGSEILELLQQGRVPLRQIGNFYGRSLPRQRAIIAGMESGQSYSRAYDESANHFDTKQWIKVANRMSCARGLQLTVARWIVESALDGLKEEVALSGISDLLQQIEKAATAITTGMLKHKFCEAENGPKTSRKRASTTVKSGPAIADKKAKQHLATAWSKLAKTARDVPDMTTILGQPPTVREVAKSLVEGARITCISSVLIPLLEAARHGQNFSELRFSPTIVEASGPELLGITSQLSIAETLPPRKLATHANPDADAIVAAWLVERFLYSAESCQVEFIHGPLNDTRIAQFDCVVDLGRTHDPARLLFDHKPPAFADRNCTCATKLVWQQALLRGAQVEHHKDLIELVHDGDAVTRRAGSAPYAQSRKTGLHAIIRHAKAYAENDHALYAAIKLYLDNRYSASC